jgi:hypothetical protein
VGLSRKEEGGRSAKRGNERWKKWKLRVRKTRFLPLAIIDNALTIRANEKNM